MKLKWKFIDNEANENEGLANSGIETFRDAPFSSIARECGQNSIDAVLDESTPVKLTFERIVVPTCEVPDIDGLREVVNNCLEKSVSKSYKKEIAFFENAKKILNDESISILRIVDSGTRGITGPCKEGTPYYALVRSTGVSEKQNDTAGGSFGIGKNAAFAMSPLRTVFYSTNYCNKKDGIDFLCQGKTILISHENSDKKKFRGTGYCGNNDYSPTESAEELPKWLKVDGIGSAVVIIGFDAEREWEEKIAESLLRNFFSSIHSGDVIFNVDNKYIINNLSIGDLFKNKEIIKSVESSGSDRLSFANSLYRCISSDLSIKEEKFISDLGKFRLSILVENGLEKQVGFIRNGMYITNELTNFKDKMKRFYSFKDFVAVIEPVDTKSISLIRATENPKHDEFSPSRIDDPSERKQVIKGFNELTSWAKNRIKEFTTPPPKDEIILEEMNDFFSDQDGKDIIDSDEGENNLESIKIKKINLKVTTIGDKKNKSFDDGDGDGDGGNFNPDGSENKKKTDNPKAPMGKKDDKDSPEQKDNDRVLKYIDLRTILGNSPSERILFFTPSITSEAIINIFTPGLSKQDEISILSVENGRCEKNQHIINVHEGVRNKIVVHFNEPYDGPILVSLSKGELL